MTNYFIYVQQGGRYPSRHIMTYTENDMEVFTEAEREALAAGKTIEKGGFRFVDLRAFYDAHSGAAAEFGPASVREDRPDRRR